MTSPTSTDAVTLLRELEWGRMGISCPYCGFRKAPGYESIVGNTHHRDCRLAKAIAEQPAEAVGENDGWRYVGVTAADFCWNSSPPWDGSPFTEMPAWLEGAITDGRIKPHTRNSTDYTEWDVETSAGVISASPDDVIGFHPRWGLRVFRTLRTRIEAEDRAKSGGEQRNPDHVYDKADWEWTSTWDDRNTLTDELDVGEIIHVGTLYKGPDKWAARIDDVEVRWFDTREAAEVALAPTPSSEKSK